MIDKRGIELVLGMVLVYWLVNLIQLIQLATQTIQGTSTRGKLVLPFKVGKCLAAMLGAQLLTDELERW